MSEIEKDEVFDLTLDGPRYYTSASGIPAVRRIVVNRESIGGGAIHNKNNGIVVSLRRIPMVDG